MPVLSLFLVMVQVPVLVLVLVLVMAMHARLHMTGQDRTHMIMAQGRVARTGSTGHVDGDCLYKECAHLILNRG